MIGTGEKAYAFVKACGIIGKSFVGRRITALNPISSLSELDRLVFGARAKELPERELLGNLERRFSGRGVEAITSVLKSFKKVPELFALLLRVYEYTDLKTALALLAGDNTAAKPAFTPLGRFGTINFDAWPDAKAMLAGTDLSFILPYLKDDKTSSDGSVTMETALDRHYYNKLWASLGKIKKNQRKAAEKIIAEEIILRNCAWALRLRSYYGMKAEEAAEHLVVMEKNKKLCQDALAALEYSLDDRNDFEQWKQIRFLNPDSFSGRWRADPRYFQNAASEYLYRLAMRYFRTSLSWFDKVFCFIKLKQFEEDLLTSSAEGIGMGMTGRDVLNMLEAVS